MYYQISEEAARRAKEMNSFDDYRAGSATEEYKAMVDKAAALAKRCKEGRSPEEQTRIDGILDAYSRRLANWMNAYNRNAGSCPSILIAGGSNFPVRKKDKQNERESSLWAEYEHIKAMLDKMSSIGTGGIQSGDPQAVEKLEEKLHRLEELQEHMKTVNAYYRKHGTLENCPQLTEDQRRGLEADMERGWRNNPKPYESFCLSNNNAEIRRIKERLGNLRAIKATETSQEEKDGYTYKENREIMRVQFIFDGKPDDETRAILKAHGFRWAPSLGAWQRQLTNNGLYAAKQVMQELSKM